MFFLTILRQTTFFLTSESTEGYVTVLATHRYLKRCLPRYFQDGGQSMA